MSTKPSIPLASISKNAGAPKTTSLRPSALAVTSLASEGDLFSESIPSGPYISHLNGLPITPNLNINELIKESRNNNNNNLLPGTSSSLKVMFTKCDTASCGTKVTS